MSTARDATTSASGLVGRHDRAVLAAVEAQSRGNFGLALDLFEESLAAAEALGDRRKLHAARINVSSCYLSLGDWERARSGLAAIILESDNERFISASAVQLAEALMKEGRLEKSAHYLRLGLERARAAGDQSRVISALTMQGHLAIMEGRHDEAVNLYGEAVASRAPLAEGPDTAQLVDKLGYAQVLSGRLAQGLWTLRRSLRMAESAGNTWARAEAHVDLGFGFLLAERNASAERHALRAMALAVAHGYPSIRKSSTYVLMETALRTGRDDDFDRWFQQLQDLLPDVKLSRDFFRIFDISDVINLKEF